MQGIAYEYDQFNGRVRVVCRRLFYKNIMRYRIEKVLIVCSYTFWEVGLAYFYRKEEVKRFCVGVAVC
jgi:hypothetical protein